MNKWKYWCIMKCQLYKTKHLIFSRNSKAIKIFMDWKCLEETWSWKLRRIWISRGKRESISNKRTQKEKSKMYSVDPKFTSYQLVIKGIIIMKNNKVNIYLTLYSLYHTFVYLILWNYFCYLMHHCLLFLFL